MKKDLKQYIKECDVYQRVKHENYRLAGLLQPLPIPSKPWLAMSMDFIEGLPKSQLKSVILVVVDRFTMYTSLHYPTLTLHPRLLLSICNLCLNFMVCLLLW